MSGTAGRPEEYLREDWLWEYALQQRLSTAHRLDLWDYNPFGRPQDSVPKTMNVDAFIEDVRRVATTPSGVLGVKLLLHQLDRFMEKYQGTAQVDSQAYADALCEWFPDSVFVLLTRRDRLRQAISYFRAIGSDRSYQEEGVVRSRSISGSTDRAGTVDAFSVDMIDNGQVERFRRMFVRQEARWKKILSLVGSSVIELSYEDLISEPMQSVATVYEHLGISATTLDVSDAVGVREQADTITDEAVARYSRWRTYVAPDPWSITARGDLKSTAFRRREVIVVENFYADPQAVRDYALSERYYCPYESDIEIAQGETATWNATKFKVAGECPFKSSADLRQTLEDIVGEELDEKHWMADFPVDQDGHPTPSYESSLDRSCLWNCCFHFKPANGQRLGEGVHNHVIDGWNAVGIDGWSGTIYLAPDAPVRGGLRLWRNTATGDQLAWMTPPRDWELVDSIGNVPNRLVLVRGNIPHSGFRGWSNDLERGRLFQTFFFRTRQPDRRAGVVVDLPTAVVN